MEEEHHSVGFSLSQNDNSKKTREVGLEKETPRPEVM